MTDALKPEDQVGPLNNVEILLVNGEHDRHNAEVKRLEDIRANLEKSLANTSRELQAIKDRQASMLREILKTRGKDPGRLTVRVVRRPTDGTMWIVADSPSVAT